MSRKRKQRCPACRSRLPVDYPTGLWCSTCGFDLTRKPPAPPGGDPSMARRRERRLAREDGPIYSDDHRTSHPGNPLGRGMPLGRSIRFDGESHREAWKRIIRDDPCAYCGRLPFQCRFHPEAGTVDHVIPQSKAAFGEGHNWLNYAGACHGCNESKKDTPLLVWMARRPLRRVA